MCGIWGYISKLKNFSSTKKKELYYSFLNIQSRGPDRTNFLELVENVRMFFGFHRLAIMDRSTKGDQPFVLEYKNRTIYCLCNGEIFNFQEIKEKYNLETYSNSDCEVIPLLYEKVNFDILLQELVGEFAFMIIDVYHDQNKIIVKGARDQIGVRPMFYGHDDNGFAFCSEMKGLKDIVDRSSIKPFPPGSYIDMVIDSTDDIKMDFEIKQYYSLDVSPRYVDLNDETLFKPEILQPYFKNIVNHFERSVICRAESDRPTGALLSGGLDSSLVVAILSRYYKEKYNKRMRTFSIGMPGSTDEKYARMVANHCGTDHTHIQFTTDEFLSVIKDVIWATETHDITTIRASVGQYLISKWISENTDIKVLYIGDGSDELCSGYMYFHKCPTPNEAHEENKKLLKELYLYDVLRADRGIASNGLEARVPFLDYRFVDYYLSLDPRLRVPHNGVEKWLLRSAFKESGYLPNKVLFRKKEAFSDGVSSKEKSWYQIIQDKAETIYSDEEFKVSEDILKQNGEYPIPPNKEALYFRNLFLALFGPKVHTVIPKYWLPNWCGDITEPSARVLDIYKD